MEFHIKWFYNESCKLDPKYFEKCSKELKGHDVKRVLGKIIGRQNRISKNILDQNKFKLFSGLIPSLDGFRKMLLNETKTNEKLKNLKPITIITSSSTSTASTTTTCSSLNSTISATTSPSSLTSSSITIRPSMKPTIVLILLLKYYLYIDIDLTN